MVICVRIVGIGKGIYDFMLSLIIFIDLSFIAIILLISLYFDLKFRKISNKFLKTSFFFSIFLNTIELLFFYSDILHIKTYLNDGGAFFMSSTYAAVR